INPADDRVYAFAAVDSYHRGAEDGLGLPIDDHLHDTQRRAALAGPADPGHRHFADQSRAAATGPRLALADAGPPQRRIGVERVGGDAVGHAARVAVEQIRRHDLVIVPGRVSEGPTPV